MLNPKITYWRNGQKESEVYFVNGKYHRPNGPTVTYWHENGQIEAEYYYINNVLHRINGPARTWWWMNGQIEAEYYYINNALHRIDGPARTWWYDDGQKKSEYYYINGVKYSKETHPFNVFRKEHKLGEYDNWSEDMKVLFKLSY